MLFMQHPGLFQLRRLNSHIILYSKKELSRGKPRPMEQDKFTLFSSCFYCYAPPLFKSCLWAWKRTFSILILFHSPWTNSRLVTEDNTCPLIFNYCICIQHLLHVKHFCILILTLSVNCVLYTKKLKLREVIWSKVVWLVSGRMRYSFYGKKGCFLP